jgi:hypothetical protein
MQKCTFIVANNITVVYPFTSRRDKLTKLRYRELQNMIQNSVAGIKVCGIYCNLPNIKLYGPQKSNSGNGKRYRACYIIRFSSGNIKSHRQLRFPIAHILFIPTSDKFQRRKRRTGSQHPRCLAVARTKFQTNCTHGFPHRFHIVGISM